MKEVKQFWHIIKEFFTGINGDGSSKRAVAITYAWFALIPLTLTFAGVYGWIAIFGKPESVIHNTIIQQFPIVLASGIGYVLALLGITAYEKTINNNQPPA